MKPDPYEAEIIAAYESGKIVPVASKAELQRLKAAARATAIKDRRVKEGTETSAVQSRPARKATRPRSRTDA
jgi:hypothetical protein